jgi:hypothetical protein
MAQSRKNSLLVLFFLTVTLFSSDFHSVFAEPVSYRREVVPLLTKLGCNSGPCHGNLTGKGGLKLSLRGEDPARDWYVLTHEAGGRRVSMANAEESLMLTKPSGLIAHEGGIRFKVGDESSSLLLRWIQQGAEDDSGQARQELIGLEVSPGELWLDAGEKREVSVKVIAKWSDGRKTDVTRLASFDVNDPTSANITPDGLFSSNRAGEWVVGVRYLGGHGVSRIVFLEDHPGYQWAGPVARNAIDQAVFSRHKRLKRNPSGIAAEQVLVRRLYLDLLGILPTPAEIRAYEDDTSADRYEKLVDRLLARQEFAEYWAESDGAEGQLAISAMATRPICNGSTDGSVCRRADHHDRQHLECTVIVVSSHKS